MTYKIEKVANMIFITDDTDQVWKAWGVEDFTERKLQNAKKKLQSFFKDPITWINCLDTKN